MPLCPPVAAVVPGRAGSQATSVAIERSDAMNALILRVAAQ
jgi:hypothetical protein